MAEICKYSKVETNVQGCYTESWYKFVVKEDKKKLLFHLNSFELLVSAYERKREQSGIKMSHYRFDKRTDQEHKLHFLVVVVV